MPKPHRKHTHSNSQCATATSTPSRQPLTHLLRHALRTYNVHQQPLYALEATFNTPVTACTAVLVALYKTQPRPTRHLILYSPAPPGPSPLPDSHLDPAALALFASLLRPRLATNAFTDGADLVAGYGQTARLSVVQVLQGHLELVPVVLSLAGALCITSYRKKKKHAHHRPTDKPTGTHFHRKEVRGSTGRSGHTRTLACTHPTQTRQPKNMKEPTQTCRT